MFFIIAVIALIFGGYCRNFIVGVIFCEAFVFIVFIVLKMYDFLGFYGVEIVRKCV